MNRLAAIGLAALASAGPAIASDDCPPLHALGDGVYLAPAKGRSPTPGNRGRTGNSTILLGATGIVIVDPGPSLKSGLSLRCSIDRLSPLPVVAVINTHAHPQHVLANGAFPGAAIHATRATADAMRQRCPICLEHLKKSIGAGELAGTEPVIPDQIVDTESTVEPGGRTLRLVPLGRAHGPGDLAVIDPTSATLIAGDLANREAMPEFTDGSLRGSIAALRRLLGIRDVKRVVAGLGAPYPPEGLAEPLRYLDNLLAIANREVAAGNMTPPANTPSEISPWDNDALRHSLNLQQALREAEAEWWNQKDTGATQTGGTPVQQ